MPRSVRYILLPCLDAKIEAAGATNITLGEQAGCSSRTVSNARHDKLVTLAIGVALYQALNTRQFSRSPIGPHKWTPARRKAYEMRQMQKNLDRGGKHQEQSRACMH